VITGGGGRKGEKDRRQKEVKETPSRPKRVLARPFERGVPELAEKRKEPGGDLD